MGEARDAMPPGGRGDCPTVRWGLTAFGCLNVGLGVVGAFLPLMPTTIFLLIALWAFSRSSLRLHRWLYDHPRLGRSLRAWHTHRVIPLRAKALAMMAGSFLAFTLFVAEGWLLPMGLAAVLGAVSTYIVTRPSAVAAGADNQVIYQKHLITY